uniref:Uncharacterized protein n=1 Tax=Oryza nivara TaxID=4536 RepID=A0A0E0J0E6_ORYNI
MEETPLPSGKNFRSQLAAAARSISWTYAIFWSISTSRPGVLTWKDGFYNGEIKTRKITSSMNLTADELVLQRSEQLRELYDSLISGECGRRARRPVAALSPEDLGDTELYYLVCMTYAFCPGQGLPGKSFASNEYVWLSNAQSADRKLFHRALIAKVSEDPALVDRITASLWDTPPRAAFSSEAGVADIVVFEDLDHGNAAVEATTTMVPGEPEPHAVAGGEVAECESNAHNDLEQITMDDIGELYSLCEELDPTIAASNGNNKKKMLQEHRQEGARAKRKAPAPEDTDGERRHCVSNVNVTIMDNKELLLELQCQWKELLMTRVFDAIKGVSLDVLSVQASTSDGLLGLKIQAKVVVSAAKSSQQICSIVYLSIYQSLYLRLFGVLILAILLLHACSLPHLLPSNLG